MNVIERSREQIFPVLDAAQVETTKRFASGIHSVLAAE